MCIGLAGGALGLIPMAGNMFTMGSAIAQGISDNNTSKQQARALEQQGLAAVGAANYDAARIREEGRQVEGENRVTLASSGVDLGSASAIEVAMKNARDTELDALLTIHGGQLQKRNADVEAKSARAQGRMSLINSGLKVASFAANRYEQSVRKG